MFVLGPGGSRFKSAHHLTLLASLYASHPIFIQTKTNKRSPSDFLKSVLGRPVRVKLNSGIEYRGVLACLDGYLNIAMEQTEEYVDGQLKAKYGDCFIRGNNGASCNCSVDSFDSTMLHFLFILLLLLYSHHIYHAVLFISTQKRSR